MTGGVGALGLRTARWLAENGARQLVLTSRRGAIDPAAATEIESLKRFGTLVSVVAADISRGEDVDALLANIKDSEWPLKGIVHAAGVITSVPLKRMTEDDIRAVLAAKVAGAWLLHDRTKDVGLDMFVFFSSVASVIGSQGHAHYGAANAFLDVLALERRRLGLPAVSINWGPWKGGGMASVDQLAQFDRIGNRGLEPEAAVQALQLA